MAKLPPTGNPQSKLDLPRISLPIRANNLRRGAAQTPASQQVRCSTRRQPARGEEETRAGIPERVCSRLPYGGPFAVRRIRMLWRMSADNGAVLQ